MNAIKDVPLKAYNTFGVSANAANYFEIKEERDLIAALETAERPIYPLGGGSNVLLTKDVAGSVFHINILGIDKVDSDEDGDLIRVGAGEVWHDLVLWTIDKGYFGLENLSLIPGKVGAAPIQNIGAYGVEQESIFVALEAIEITTGKLQVFSHQECLFGYRDSYFKNEGKGKYCITAVYYRLTKTGELTLGYGAVKTALENKGITNQIALLKKENESMPSYPVIDQPELLKTSAAWLIDQCGWKGKKIGETGTYKNHALVLVNHGNANGNEIWQVAQDIIADVKSKFGVELEPEVNVW